MTDIEKKALALVSDILPEDAYRAPGHFIDKRLMWNALCRAIEQHEAFRQEVSDFAFAIKNYIERRLGEDRFSIVSAAGYDFADFIIPKPDPLAEAVQDVWEYAKGCEHLAPARADQLRAAVEARGGRIVWESE